MYQESMEGYMFDLEDYCKNCVNFSPDISLHEEMQGCYCDNLSISTVRWDIRCNLRSQCKNIYRYLENRNKNKEQGND